MQEIPARIYRFQICNKQNVKGKYYAADTGLMVEDVSQYSRSFGSLTFRASWSYKPEGTVSGLRILNLLYR